MGHLSARKRFSPPGRRRRRTSRLPTATFRRCPARLRLILLLILMNAHSLVIGGTRGVGREVVRLFSARDHTVSVIGKRPPSEEDRKLQGVSFWSADLVDMGARSSALDEIIQGRGKLNYLVFLQRFKGDGDKWAGELD